MYKYVLKRLLYMIPVVLGVAFLVFVILSLTPGDPGSIILGITADPEDIAALNAEFGYDQPFLIRFINYIGDIVLHFDLGTSYQSRQPVINDIIARFPILWCWRCCPWRRLPLSVSLWGSSLRSVNIRFWITPAWWWR